LCSLYIERNQTDLIRDGRRVRERFGKIHAGAAVLFELERAAHQLIRFAAGLECLDLERMHLAIELLQLWFWIEQVHLAGTTILHELNHSFRSRPKMARRRP
jgi:hypothetical protein